MIYLVLLLLAICLPASAQQPGAFDHYVLSLSWSPEFCHSNPEDPECNGPKRYGFIVHGLWPEFRDGGGPEHCSQEPLRSTPPGLIDVMPDTNLIEHEWLTHGTCAGLTADSYFNLVRRAFGSVRIPREFMAPEAQFRISPFEIKQAFLQANSNLRIADITISCAGPYLRAVNICLTKTLRPMPCHETNDCRARIVRVPPVR